MSLATDQIIGWVKDKFQWNKNFQEASSFGQSFGVPDVNLNSIQHSYFSADLQFKYGAQWPGLAEVLGNALELDSALRRDLFGGNDLRYDTYKDLWNNDVGRRIGEYARENGLTFNDAKDLIRRAYYGHNLQFRRKTFARNQDYYRHRRQSERADDRLDQLVKSGSLCLAIISSLPIRGAA